MAQNLPTPVDPAIFSALDPDSILPEQFFPEQQPNWTGEMSLLWTVFSDGLETYCKEVSLGHEQSELFLETLEWVELRGHDSIFSFESLCEVFHLDPGSVRRSLHVWRERHHALNPKAA
jgi:hypothetical protein